MNAAEFVRRLVAMVPWPMRQHIRKIPLVAQAQRVLVSRVLDGAVFEHRVDAGPAKGITFSLRMPDDKGILTGTYEVDFASKLAQSIRRGDVAFDIGGWHGFFAGVMASQGASEVHVFEPLPANVDRIQQLIDLNPDRKIELHNCAVGETESAMDLLVMPETSMAKLEASTFQAGQSGDGRIRVSVVSIDELVAAGRLPRPNVMKIDVEGAEILVLRGASTTIKSSRPQIFCEVHSSDLLLTFNELMAELGYEVEHLDSDAAEARDRDVFQVRAYPANEL